MSTTIRHYTDDFKRDAVQYVESHPEMTLTQVAECLGVPTGTLYGWIKNHRRKARGEDDASSATSMTDSEKELSRLRRENRDLKDALAVLKKAISILNN